MKQIHIKSVSACPTGLRRRRGVVLMDIITAFAVLSIVFLSISWGMMRQKHGAVRLAERRAMVHLAERVLADLQYGAATAATQPSPQPGMEAAIRILDDTSPSGQCWVEINVQYKGRNQKLVGLAPRVAVEGRP